MSKRTNTRAMVECALMIALGTVLAQIKIFQMPYGGSVTLVSSLPFILVSYRHGIKWGVMAGLANGVLQMLTGWYAPPAGTITAIVACVMLDYLLAFSCLGLASGFSKPIPNKTAGMFVGISAVMILRFLCSFLSGALLWGSYQSYYEWASGMSVWMYSFLYNSSYMLPELIITAIAGCLIASAYPKLFDQQK
ncbi:MAG: energy-coupled thiamine transporter ThiT [Oscillospiraceae bacterium]|nr:energy-coupled thiamine transporter ThiT [Oscillospiraceae bacterium]